MDKLTEKKLEETTVRVSRDMALALNDDEAIELVRGVIAALPKPEPVGACDTKNRIHWTGEDDNHRYSSAPNNIDVGTFIYTEAPIAPPASAPIGWDAEFLAKRLRRVAKMAGVSTPERFTHEQVAETAGTTLGQIAAAIEGRAIQLDTFLARLEVISEVHVISATYDRIRTERIFAADDLEYDLFATGMKTAIEMMKGGA